jgi:hypothetical protein
MSLIFHLREAYVLLRFFVFSYTCIVIFLSNGFEEMFSQLQKLLQLHHVESQNVLCRCPWTLNLPLTLRPPVYMQDRKCCDSLSIYGTVTFPPSVITDALEIVSVFTKYFTATPLFIYCTHFCQLSCAAVNWTENWLHWLTHYLLVCSVLHWTEWNWTEPLWELDNYLYGQIT